MDGPGWCIGTASFWLYVLTGEGRPRAKSYRLHLYIVRKELQKPLWYHQWHYGLRITSTSAVETVAFLVEDKFVAS